MKKVSIFGMLLGVFFVSGCPNVPGNPAEVLEGTWQVTLDEPGDLEGFDIQATFDANGELTLITAESPAGAVAMLNVEDSTSEVDGNDVTITIPTDAGNRTLTGTLSEDENTITGTLSNTIILPDGDGQVTLPGSDLTLERIE